MRKKMSMVFLFFFLLAGRHFSPLQAQTDDPGGDNTVGTDPDTQQVPLDGGLALLLAAGAGYGLRKYRHEVREKNKSRRYRN